jgi:hypothetical protein
MSEIDSRTMSAPFEADHRLSPVNMRTKVSNGSGDGPIIDVNQEAEEVYWKGLILCGFARSRSVRLTGPA